MGKNNTKSRGFGSNAMRKRKHEMFVKTLNRKANHEGTTKRSQRVNGKV
jgi:hypothetical protein